MKKLLVYISFTALCFSISLCCFTQTLPSTAVYPDSTYHFSNENGSNGIPNTPIICDYRDIRIFPSNNPQSEMHLSINKRNPLVLLLSSQTYFINNSVQGAYWSTNGGVNWTGSDNLPNGASYF